MRYKVLQGLLYRLCSRLFSPYVIIVICIMWNDMLNVIMCVLYTVTVFMLLILSWIAFAVEEMRDTQSLICFLINCKIYICLNCKIYLFELQNIFAQSALGKTASRPVRDTRPLRVLSTALHSVEIWYKPINCILNCTALEFSALERLLPIVLP